MPTRKSRKSIIYDMDICKIVLEINHIPFLFLGQTNLTTPLVYYDFLSNKYLTSKLLESFGYSAPSNIVIYKKEDLTKIAFEKIIFKPISDANRVGVVGPVHVKDTALVEKCYERSISQVSSGPSLVMAEQFIDGEHFRINVNYKKVTFVAKSERRHIVGDGKKSIRGLIFNKKKIKYAFRMSEKFSENILIGKGLSLKSVP